MTTRLEGEKAVPLNTLDVAPIYLQDRDVVTEKNATKGADALLAYVDNSQPVVLDDETSRRLLRKIDTHVLPWLCGLYILQYLDKGVLSYSSVMGIMADADLTTSQFTWLGSIYYLGYMAALPLHNRMFQVFAPSKYIAANMMAWGLVLAFMALCHNFTGLMVQRAFLGSLESVINCGFVLLTARWYRKYEHGARVAIWSSCNGLAGIVGALIAYGCLSGVDAGVHILLPSWKIMALCLGCASVIYGAAMFVFVAPSLVEARFFTEEEKVLAIERLRDNHQGIGSKEFKWYQVREAFLDVRTWLYVAFVLTSQMPTAGLSLLSSLLIKSLNFDSKQTLLLGMPGGALQVVFQLSAGFIADRTQQRSLTAIAMQLLCLFAAALLIGLANLGPLYDRAGQLAAFFLTGGACAIGYYLLLATVASNVLGTTKKMTTNVILFLSMAVAYLVGPQMFRDPPYYYRAKYATVGLWAASVIILLVLYILNRWENSRRDKIQAQLAERGIADAENVEFLDLTDKENLSFRYVQ
ncbi:major facilitator superfamily domain-containing protein [Truncatella angustata]|uniref:Major facilitator superfamily domain-containing protein n=1 Tax=Truncatella angustata TaxID=152316 RepID=A0A9P8ZVT3_9PEZI|nr:major facilitator superfamily domain-containing protein [Truncatella angustata]KAH6652320.1 major facilitator superfamily domain-containing protein [Truncatella angustata]